MPSGEPEWLLYEVDWKADAVLRSVELFGNGSVTRNSIWIEQRSGQRCESLFDRGLEKAFEDVPLVAITAQEFEGCWERGVDTPFWFPCGPTSSGSA